MYYVTMKMIQLCAQLKGPVEKAKVRIFHLFQAMLPYSDRQKHRPMGAIRLGSSVNEINAEALTFPMSPISEAKRD